eukprot:5843228-Prymnesium_polylepis.2
MTNNARALRRAEGDALAGQPSSERADHHRTAGALPTRQTHTLRPRAAFLCFARHTLPALQHLHATAPGRPDLHGGRSERRGMQRVRASSRAGASTAARRRLPRVAPQ